MTRALPDHDAMVAAIVATYRDASDAQRDAGRSWYPAAGAIVDAIAADTGRTRASVAYAMAALSPRNPWRWNVQDAYAFACAAREGADRPPSATTFATNVDRAWSAINGAIPWTTAAPKVRAFVAAILGDDSAVVVDTWAIRVATGGAMIDVTDREYAHVVEAYREAAERIGADARDVQAVTWTVAQDAGLASSRRGRHDLTFKRGTAPFVRALFERGAVAA